MYVLELSLLLLLLLQQQRRCDSGYGTDKRLLRRYSPLQGILRYGGGDFCAFELAGESFN